MKRSKRNKSILLRDVVHTSKVHLTYPHLSLCTSCSGTSCLLSGRLLLKRRYNFSHDVLLTKSNKWSFETKKEITSMQGRLWGYEDIKWQWWNPQSTWMMMDVIELKHIFEDNLTNRYEPCVVDPDVSLALYLFNKILLLRTVSQNCPSRRSLKRSLGLNNW